MLAGGGQAEARATPRPRTRLRRAETADGHAVVALEVGMLRRTAVVLGIVDLVEAIADDDAPDDLVGREGIARARLSCGSGGAIRRRRMGGLSGRLGSDVT